MLLLFTEKKMLTEKYMKKITIILISCLQNQKNAVEIIFTQKLLENVINNYKKLTFLVLFTTSKQSKNATVLLLLTEKKLLTKMTIITK